MLTDNLKKLRQKRNLNKRQTAELFTIPYTTYNNYETGAREPDSEMLIMFSKEYEVSIDYLLGNSVNTNEKHKPGTEEYDLKQKITTKCDDLKKEDLEILLKFFELNDEHMEHVRKVLLYSYQYQVTHDNDIEKLISDRIRDALNLGTEIGEIQNK